MGDATVDARLSGRSLGDPLALLSSNTVLDKINAYVLGNPMLSAVMDNGNGIVFLFEGAGAGGPDSYSVASNDARDQALAVIVKHWKVTYVNERASTIASGDPKTRTRSLRLSGTIGVATICDGIYKLRLCSHKGYEAFNLTLDGSIAIPCIRWIGDGFRLCPLGDPAGLWARGINLHTRDSICDQASDGCMLVGTHADFSEFMSCAKAATVAETDASTYCVVDRSMATGLNRIFDKDVCLLTAGAGGS